MDTAARLGQHLVAEQGGFRARQVGRSRLGALPSQGALAGMCVCRGDSRGWMQKPGSPAEDGAAGAAVGEGDEQRAKVKRRDSV